MRPVPSLANQFIWENHNQVMQGAACKMTVDNCAGCVPIVADFPGLGDDSFLKALFAQQIWNQKPTNDVGADLSGQLDRIPFQGKFSLKSSYSQTSEKFVRGQLRATSIATVVRHTSYTVTKRVAESSEKFSN